MAQLASHFETMALRDVSTYINSGNVLFSGPASVLAELESRIERDLEPLLGFKSDVFLRSAPELHRIAATAAEHRRAVPASGEVNVAFLACELDAGQTQALHLLGTDLDGFAHEGRQIYWLCKGRQSDSKFSNALLERKLKLRCTFRRASMLEKLSAQLATRP